LIETSYGRQATFARWDRDEHGWQTSLRAAHRPLRQPASRGNRPWTTAVRRRAHATVGKPRRGRRSPRQVADRPQVANECRSCGFPRRRFGGGPRLVSADRSAKAADRSGRNWTRRQKAALGAAPQLLRRGNAWASACATTSAR